MLTPHDINQAYSKFFLDWAAEHLTETRQALLITTTFDHESQMRRRRETVGLDQGSYEKTAFQHLYNVTARQLVGSNYNRPSKRSQLPNVATFLDAEATKFWRTVGDFRNVHLHSIWIVETDKIEMLKRTLDLKGRNGGYLQALGFDAIDIRAIGTSDTDLNRVVTYASKLLGFNSESLNLGMDFEIYPLGARQPDGDPALVNSVSSTEVDTAISNSL